MVIDKIENAQIYKDILNPRLGKALTYLQLTDFTHIKPGKYAIDGDDIYMLIQEYDTKDISVCKLEGHKRYIDIQYIVSGVELIGFTTLKDQHPINGCYENDCAFFEAPTSLIKIEAGMFAIFFSDDLHMPCVKNEGCSKVKKIVIKVVR